uniref:Uncharacterized protein n=1 Tax=Anguilla anguilla TaxID=7936 RepID=A0A0E9RHN5_ANGAN
MQKSINSRITCTTLGFLKIII